MGMDFKLIATTFAAVFIAELGDKTRLATLSFASSGSSRWSVFMGAALALIATTAVAVIAGAALSRVIPPRVLQRGAGVLFLIIGSWVLYSTRG
jgi:putative Ca2+/H+ antiporter (TMEM165/GDT1 family)